MIITTFNPISRQWEHVMIHAPSELDKLRAEVSRLTAETKRSRP